MKRNFTLAFPFVLLLAFAACSGPVVTLGKLLEEMTDREALTRFPDPYYTTAQFSSYDRATVAPGDKSWFANWDRSMFIGTDTIGDRVEYIMMDTEGPGAVVRFWMTFAGDNSGKGILRFYLDGNPVPAIEGVALDILSGGALADEPLSASVSDLTAYHMRGHNLYLPIPYSERCKITYETQEIKDFGAKTGGESVYYNINYRTYGSGTRVVTYCEAEKQKYQSLLEQTQRNLYAAEATATGGIKYDLDGTIEKGGMLTLTKELKGSAISALSFNIDAADREQALRCTVLEISFDGKTTVNVPVGDFFGTGYQIRPFRTWYASVDDSGNMECHWLMPFRKDFSVRLVNKGDQEVTVTNGSVTVAPYKWDSSSMYFCSSWKQFTRLETGEMKNNEGDGDPFDINYVEIDGKGVYVGDGIVLFNTVYAWWGEGDEKVYVDGETFPSHIGTGTEDYYGYAWCRPEKFTGHPFIAQPDGSGNFDPGYTVNLRYRSLDGIPFRRSLRFDMEMWHWTRAIINFAPVTYWYQTPATVGDVQINDEELREPVVIEREQLISPAMENGRVEGENMVLKLNEDGNFRYSNDVNRGWSGNMQLVWTGTVPGKKLTMEFHALPKAGSSLKVVYSEGKNYRPFRVSVNGSVPVTVNPHKPGFGIAEVTLNNVTLKDRNELVVERLAAPDNRNIIGIDYVELIR